MKAFVKSVGHAVRGISLILGGRNFRIQIGVALLATIAGFVFSISTTEWLIVIITIFVVLTTEAINTAVEEVCDTVKDLQGIHRLATKESRDIAAGSSLIISIGAAIIGLIIFLPKILAIF